MSMSLSSMSITSCSLHPVSRMIAIRAWMVRAFSVVGSDARYFRRDSLSAGIGILFSILQALIQRAALVGRMLRLCAHVRRERIAARCLLIVAGLWPVFESPAR